MEEVNKGKDIVLLGHSAGSVVVFNLVMYRSPLINIYQILKEAGRFDDEILNAFKEKQFTCAQALLDSKVAKIDETGNFIGLLQDLKMKDKKKLAEIKDSYFKENLATVVEYT